MTERTECYDVNAAEDDLVVVSQFAIYQHALGNTIAICEGCGYQLDSRAANFNDEMRKHGMCGEPR